MPAALLDRHRPEPPFAIQGSGLLVDVHELRLQFDDDQTGEVHLAVKGGATHPEPPFYLGMVDNLGTTPTHNVDNRPSACGQDARERGRTGPERGSSVE